MWPSCLKQKGDTNEEHRPYVQTSSGFSFLNALALLSQKVIKYYVLSYHFIIILLHQIRSDQSLSRVRLFANPWTTARQAFLSITNSRSLSKLMSIESVMPSNCLIFCRPLLLSSIFPSIRVFSNESVLRYQVAKVLEFQLQHQSFQWTPRTDLL